MGSIDIPPFMRDKIKAESQANKSDIPPFMQKKKDGGTPSSDGVLEQSKQSEQPTSQSQSPNVGNDYSFDPLKYINTPEQSLEPKPATVVPQVQKSSYTYDKSPFNVDELGMPAIKDNSGEILSINPKTIPITPYGNSKSYINDLQARVDSGKLTKQDESFLEKTRKGNNTFNASDDEELLSIATKYSTDGIPLDNVDGKLEAVKVLKSKIQKDQAVQNVKMTSGSGGLKEQRENEINRLNEIEKKLIFVKSKSDAYETFKEAVISTDESGNLWNKFLNRVMALSPVSTVLGQVGVSLEVSENKKKLPSEFSLGLNSLKYLEPVQFERTVRALKNNEPISETEIANITAHGLEAKESIAKDAFINKDIDKAQYENAIVEINKSRYENIVDNKETLRAFLSSGIANLADDIYSVDNSGSSKIFGHKWDYSDDEIDVFARAYAQANGIDPNDARVKDAVKYLQDNEGAMIMQNSIAKSGWARDFAKGLASPIRGISSTLEDIGKTSSQIYAEGQSQGNVNVSEQKLNRIKNSWEGTVSDVVEGAGQLVTQAGMAYLGSGLIGAAGSGLLGRAGVAALEGDIALADMAAKDIVGKVLLGSKDALATYLTAAGQSYDGHLKQALTYTSDDATAKNVARGMAGLEGITETILSPLTIARNISKNLFSSGAASKGLVSIISDAAIVDKNAAVKNFLKATLKGGLETAKVVGTEIGEEEITQIADYTANMMLNPDSKSFQDRDLLQEVQSTAYQTGLSMAIPALVSGFGAFNVNNFAKGSLLVAAQNRQSLIDGMDKDLFNGNMTQSEYNEKAAIINTAAVANETLPLKTSGNKLNSQEKADYVFSRVSEGILKKKFDESKDEAEKTVLTEKIKNEQNFRTGMLKVENGTYSSQPQSQQNGESNKETNAEGQGQEGVLNTPNTEVVGNTASVTFSNEEQAAIDGFKGAEFTGSVKNWTDIIQSETATPQEKKQALQEMKDQLSDPNSEIAMGEALGKSADLIYSLVDADRKMQAQEAVNEPDNLVPDISVGEMLDKTGTYNGQRGSFYQDGQTVVFKVEGQNKEYELGNIDEVQNTSIKDFNITNEESVVSLDDAGNIKVREESYVNNFSNQLAAINKDADGNVVSVNLETADGKKRTFRGNVAEDVAYQINLKEINKDNETRTNFENFINTDAAAQEAINNEGVSAATTQVASTPNSEVQRKKIEPVKNVEPSTVKSEEVQISENKDFEVEGRKAFDITNNGGKVGEVSLEDNGESYQVSNIKVNTPNKGIGTEAYRKLINTLDKPLVSDAIRSNSAEAVWKKLEKEGLAIFNENTKQYESVKSENKPIQSEPATPTVDNTAQQENTAPEGQTTESAVPNNSESMGGGNATTPAPVSGEVGDGSGITHAQTAETLDEFGLPEYQKEAQTFAAWDAEAEERIKNGEMPALIQKMKNGGQPNAVETRMMGKYIAYLKDIASKTKSAEDISKMHEAIRLSDFIGGSENARGLVARKGLFQNDGTLADFFQDEMDAISVDTLTEQQISDIGKEHAAISEAEKAWEAERERLNARVIQLEAEAALKKEKAASASKPKTKKTHDDFVKDREKIIENIKKKLKQARGSSNVAIVPYANELFAIAPDALKLMSSLVSEGVTKLSDVITSMHETLRDAIPQITESDVRDIIAGAYNEKKRTRSEAAKDLFNLKLEAKLINRLAELESGNEPATEKKKIERNKEITDLRNKIAKFRRDNPTDVDRLEAIKKSYETSIKKVEEELRTGSFLNPEPPRPSVKLDDAALAAKDKLIKLKNERKLRLIRAEYANRSITQKAIGLTANILNIPRALMTTLDFSAVLRQGLIPSVAHPRMSFNAAMQMFKSAWTQEEYDRWFYDLEETPRFNLMKESGLALTDNTNPLLTAREEDFMSNLVEKIPLVGQALKVGNVTVPGANLIKKSERAYAAYINKMRVDLFNRMADEMELRGLDFENSPAQFKQLAGYVNNATGRGSMGESLDKIAPLLNSIFFSPRLIASRLNMLTYFAQPSFYKEAPVEVRRAYFNDMARVIGIGVGVLALASLAGSADDDEKYRVKVESDPRSSDFGKIKSGNTRWDIWGGFQPFVRVAAQALTGQRKATTTGEIKDLDKAFGSSRTDVILSFARGKLSPVPAMAVDIFSKRTQNGDRLVWETGTKDKPKQIKVIDYFKDHLLPLSVTGLNDAMKDQGVQAIFTVGIPSIFGVGTQVYKK